jgi:hypothetical protein
MQFDSVSVTASQTRSLASGHNHKKNKDLLDGETIKQLSGGSLSGNLTLAPKYLLPPGLLMGEM